MSTERKQSHETLNSLLTDHHLPLPLDVRTATNSNAFEFDSNRSPESVFPHSVSSGSPSPTGVILWTRVEPTAYDADRPLAIEVATDEAFSECVFRGVIEQPDQLPERDYTVKIDLDGTLNSNQPYYYRFIYDGVRSRVGRCRTLPASNASPESVRFALATCQDYQNGYFGTFHHIAEEDVDFLVHMGDFIYDSAAADQFKGVGSQEYPDRDITLPSGRDRPRALDDYRELYKTYKSDRFLQEALERHTLIATHDDHELAYDLYWDDETDAPHANHPKGDDPEFMTRLIAAALRAWWEYLPVRIGYSPEAEAFHERFRFWQQFQFGDLVNLFMTEGRLFRDEPWNGRFGSWRSPVLDEEDPDRTMFGENQYSWFLDQIRQSEARWDVWMSEVLTVPLGIGASKAWVYPVTTGWDGFMRERQRIMTALSQWGPSNLITVTGDMHCYLAGYQQTTYADPLTNFLTGDKTGNRIGVELMTPAVTSLNFAEEVGATRGLLADVTEDLLSLAVRLQNPHVKSFNGHRWGYSVAKFTPDECIHTVYSVDKTVNSPDAEREALQTVRVPDGRVVIEELTENAVE